MITTALTSDTVLINGVSSSVPNIIDIMTIIKRLRSKYYQPLDIQRDDPQSSLEECRLFHVYAVAMPISHVHFISQPPSRPGDPACPHARRISPPFPIHRLQSHKSTMYIPVYKQMDSRSPEQCRGGGQFRLRTVLKHSTTPLRKLQ